MANDPTVSQMWIPDQELKVIGQNVTKTMQMFAESTRVALDRATRWYAEHEEKIRACVEAINSWPARAKQAWGDAAMQGWYMSPTAPIAAISIAEVGGKMLDQFMVTHLQEDWSDLTESLLMQFPKRADILRAALKLHLEGNYIASIPLFLIQADGICADRLRAFLFTEAAKRNAAIQAWLARNPDDWTGVLLHVLGRKTQIMSSIDKASVAKKANGPNRNGILHGSRKHLDYGTQVNSYKAFSLLCFVAWCFEDDDRVSSSAAPIASD